MRSVYLFNDDLGTGKIDNTEWVYYCQTCHLFFRLYIPQKQQENWDFIHSPVFHKPRV